MINPASVVWNWSTNRSNYGELFESTLLALDHGRSWLTEYANASDDLQYRFNYGPDTDLAREDWNLATQNNDRSVWLTRLRTDLAATLLNTDLQLQSSASVTTVDNNIQVIDGHETGARPTPNCPPPPAWGRAVPVGTPGSDRNPMGPYAGGTGHATPVGCAAQPGSSARGGLIAGTLAAGLAIATVRRRRRN